VWDRHDGELVLDGSTCYPMAFTGTEVAVVVGHTGCGAVTAAYQAVTGEGKAHPRGIQSRIDTLSPVVEAGLDAVDTDTDESEIVDQLVEYNVDRQVAFLQDSDEIPDAVAVYGFVYDLHGAYGGPRGRTYLVNDDGETDPDVIREGIDESHAAYATRLTS
jgi:carbonic anhydrase